MGDGGVGRNTMITRPGFSRPPSAEPVLHIMNIRIAVPILILFGQP